MLKQWKSTKKSNVKPAWKAKPQCTRLFYNIAPMQGVGVVGGASDARFVRWFVL